MKKIILPRGGGKTESLIKEAIKNNLTIICPNNAQVKIIENRMKELGVLGICPKPVSISNWDQELRGRKINKIALDETESILQCIFRPYEVAAITLTSKKEISKKEIAYMLGVDPDNLKITD